MAAADCECRLRLRLPTATADGDCRPPTADRVGGILLAHYNAEAVHGRHDSAFVLSRRFEGDGSGGPSRVSRRPHPARSAPGSIGGVLIDPAEHKLRYFVIESPGLASQRRYLLPIEAAATMAPEGTSLRLDMETDDFTALEEFDDATVREFTEEDAIAPTFARYLA